MEKSFYPVFRKIFIGILAFIIFYFGLKMILLVISLLRLVFGYPDPVSNNTVSNERQVYYCSPNVYKGWKEGYLPFNRDTYFDKYRLSLNRKTFQILKYNCYAKDDKSVFYAGQKIAGADAATFEVIGHYHATDKYRGYYRYMPVEGSRGATFKVVDTIIEWFSTDGIDVFFESMALHVTDAGNFRIVESGSGHVYISTDGKHGYYNEFRMPSLDINTVKLLKSYYGYYKDKNWVYHRDHKINYNHKGQWIIDTIDAASFSIVNLDGNRGKDKFGWIVPYSGRIVEDSASKTSVIVPSNCPSGGRGVIKN